MIQNNANGITKPAHIFVNRGKPFKNTANKLIDAKTASIADAKFGLPKVEIIALYGFTHFTKSFPFI